MAHRLEGVGEEVVDGRGDDGVEALDAEEEEGGEAAVAVVEAVVVGMAARHTWNPSILHRQESSFPPKV